MSLTSLAHQVRFPTAPHGDLSQDEEWCEVALDGGWRRLRFHDYGEIYSIPGLYEHLFYERLRCQSPTVVGDLLAAAVEDAGEDPAELPVLDLGAGNGLVGEALRERGFEDVVGADISPEAGEAVERDRPGVYADYHVCDLLQPPADVRRELEESGFGAMTSVAALGFGDVPPEVFTAALDLVEEGGWVAFTIKQDFLEDEDESGFAALIAGQLASGRIEEHSRRRYRHRLDIHGEPLHYVAIAGRKRS
ncbi:MAG: class I SAM-dependent DNA methyltransferase [Solirubrobacteraceae bacterium]